MFGDWELSQHVLAAALVALLLAIIGWLGDRRRMRRSNPDAVGFMPWRTISFWATIFACVFFMLAAHGWLA